jgi:hypothetical protein
MNINVKNYIIIGLTLTFTACSDLEVTEKDSVVTEVGGEFQGVPVISALTTAYADLRGQAAHENTYAIQEATTDELFIPTRGTDWGDNGVWRDLATHQWSPSHLFIRNAWNELNSNVYRTNQILHEATEKTALQEAEAKFLRAWNMFLILDIWRQVPFRDADEGPEVNPRVLTPEETIAFIEGDLTDALPVLPEVGPGGNLKAASKASANYLLAKLYLNKHVYVGSATAAAADMDKVIAAVDEIKADGFDLYEGYFHIFAQELDDTETILWTDQNPGNRIWSTLHYSSGSGTDNPGGGWNGFATTAEFYDLFEGDATSNVEGGGQEERRGYVPNDGLGIGFLIGQQYSAEGEELDARGGKKLIFTKNVTSLVGNSDVTGIRVLKYHPKDGGTWRTHFLLMRYADAHLMKAEALLRKGSTAEALDLVNELRDIRGAADLGSLSEQSLLDERGRELYTEGWRRSDLIRFGAFNAEFGFNEKVDEHLAVMPIPDVAVASNPNLKQNPGYN